MSLDFQQARQQVRQMGESAPGRESRLRDLRQRAWDLMHLYDQELEGLRQKVQLVVRSHDPSLRCALPSSVNLTAHFPPGELPARQLLWAADGSQIFLDHHAAAEYFLINIGAIRMVYGDPAAPQTSIQTFLFYGDDLNISGAYPTEDRISLLRDLRERQRMADLAAQAGEPAITLTDGRLELWGASPAEAAGEANEKSLDAFLEALERLEGAGATAAGYVDKPGEDYLVRLLEIASQPPEDARQRPLRGVRDVDLFRLILAPGERSAVFETQSRAAGIYKRRKPSLTPHFFYLNVGREGHPWLARVDILAWVAADRRKLDHLHAILVHQCHMLGSRPYPYALHRAHEIARVTPDEKNQLDMMIANELRKQGILVEESHKQYLKSL